MLELSLTQQSSIRVKWLGTVFVVSKTLFFGGVHSARVQFGAVKLVV